MVVQGQFRYPMLTAMKGAIHHSARTKMAKDRDRSSRAIYSSFVFLSILELSVCSCQTRSCFHCHLCLLKLSSHLILKLFIRQVQLQVETILSRLLRFGRTLCSSSKSCTDLSKQLLLTVVFSFTIPVSILLLLTLMQLNRCQSLIS